MNSRLTLTRFSDAGSLLAALDAAKSQERLDPVRATACAWHLRQSHTLRAVSIAKSVLDGDLLDLSSEPLRTECRGYLQLVLAEAHWLNGDLARASQQGASARRSFAGLAPCTGLCDVDWLDAHLASDEGDGKARERLMRQSLRTAEALGDDERTASCGIALACFEAFGNGVAAEANWGVRVAAHLESERPALRSLAHLFKFLVCTGQANYALALAHALRSARAAEESGLMRRAILGASDVASIFADLGDLDTSIHHMEEALAKARAHGWPQPLGGCLQALADKMSKLGRHEAALEIADEAVRVLAPFPRSTNYIAAVTALGDASLACGLLDRAHACYDIVAAPGCPSDWPDATCYGLLGLAKIAERGDDLSLARELCLQALDRPSAISDYVPHIDGLLLLSQIVARQQSLRPPAGLASVSVIGLAADSQTTSGPGTSDLSPQCRHRSDPVEILRHAISLSDQYLDGANRHVLLADLSVLLEQVGAHEEALVALKSAMSSLHAEKSKSAARQSLALAVKFQTERALETAELHKRAALAESARAAELETLNRQLRAAMESLELTQSQLVQRNADLDAANAAIKELSLTDPLTGLRNRRFLTEVIESAVAECLRSYSLMRLGEMGSSADTHRHDIVFYLLDLDHFKSVNDDLGHAAGDAVLVQLRDRLRTVTREQDFLVRWGGEEFLVVVRGSSRTEAALIAERLRLSVCSSPFSVGGGRTIRKTVSIGFAAFPIDPEHPAAASWQQAVELADARLLNAKSSGRDRCVGDHVSPLRAAYESLPFDG